MSSQRITIVIVVIVFLGSLGGYSWWATHQTAPPINVSQLQNLKTIEPTDVTLPWPSYGGTALSINNGAINMHRGSEKQTPTASTAKVMTALAVLDKKPLAPDTEGPAYVATPEDVAIYNSYVAKNGSVAAVQAGTSLSERQMLSALMLPSANNIADTMVTWAFGSMPAYVEYANQKAKQLGMNDSYFADASGFSPATVSTPSDLVKLGNAAVNNAVLMEVVSQKSTVIPTAGTIYNVNSLLGQDGVIGLKTGNTDEAGGCFLMAGRITPQGLGKPITIITAIMNAPTRAQALNDSLPFMKAIAANFETVTVLDSNTPIARYSSAWGTTAEGMSQSTLTLTRWKGETIKPVAANDSITAKGLFSTATTAVAISGDLGKPSLWWRLTHP